MADYREISQEYAKGAIRAVILINGGAAVALLSQLGKLTELGYADDVALSMKVWAAGVAIGVLNWLFAFLSTRYVDKSEREAEHKEVHLSTSNTWMLAGQVAFVVSVGCFIWGCFSLAWNLG